MSLTNLANVQNTFQIGQSLEISAIVSQIHVIMKDSPRICQTEYVPMSGSKFEVMQYLDFLITSSTTITENSQKITTNEANVANFPYTTDDIVMPFNTMKLSG